jgi:hypothetical protein
MLLKHGVLPQWLAYISGTSTTHSYGTHNINNRQKRQTDSLCNTGYELNLHMANHTRLCCNHLSAWDAQKSDRQAVMSVSNAACHTVTYLHTFCAA